MRYRLAKCKKLLKPGMVLIYAMIFLGGLGIGMPAISEAAGEDRYYEADFDTVWDAAIAVVQEERFIIKLMNKKDGYLSGDWQGGNSRAHVGIRISEEYGLVRVQINYSSESLEYKEKTKTYIWESGSYDGREYLHNAITSELLMRFRYSK